MHTSHRHSAPMHLSVIIRIVINVPIFVKQDENELLEIDKKYRKRESKRERGKYRISRNRKF